MFYLYYNSSSTLSISKYPETFSLLSAVGKLFGRVLLRNDES